MTPVVSSGLAEAPRSAQRARGAGRAARGRACRAPL